MSELSVDGASCDTGKKMSNVGDLCPAVAMVRLSIFSLSDFKKGLLLSNFHSKSMKCTFTLHFQTNIVLSNRDSVWPAWGVVYPPPPPPHPSHPKCCIYTNFVFCCCF